MLAVGRAYPWQVQHFTPGEWADLEQYVGVAGAADHDSDDDGGGEDDHVRTRRRITGRQAP